MHTNEPKLKSFVAKWNKRNRKIEEKRKKDKVLIKYTIEKEIKKK